MTQGLASIKIKSLFLRRVACLEKKSAPWGCLFQESPWKEIKRRLVLSSPLALRPLCGGTPDKLWRNTAASLNLLTCFVTFFCLFVFFAQRCLCACLLALLFPSIIPLGTAVHSNTHTHTRFHLAVWLLIRQAGLFKHKKLRLRICRPAVAQVLEWLLFPLCRLLRYQI